ncbi:hypothetical protein C2S52_006528 [Perilla frutescens var. hirtella]|nr:hypothetical protein C2S52_006528 [Perilla frutescens var. hirtella]
MDHSAEEERISRFSFLPNEILVEILCRLPDESLVRFKSVSKAWHLLISETCIPLLPSLRLRPSPIVGMFLRTYNLIYERFITRSPFDDLSTHFLSDRYRPLGRIYRETLLLGDYASLKEDRGQLFGWQECFSSYGLPFRPDPDDLLGCCNGLLLFVNIDSLHYYVSNPSTRQCVSIPWPPFTPKEFPFAALAFDPSQSSCYKVVRFECRTWEDTDVVLDIYSSSNKSWTRHSLQFESFVRPSLCIRAATYFDGALFRLSRSWKVVQFDLEELSIRATRLPANGEECGHVIGSIGVLMRQLCYGNQCCNMVHIWTLEKSFIWSLRHRINICDLSRGVHLLNRMWGDDMTKWVEPIAFHPTASVVYLGSPLVILSYDLENDKFVELFRKTTFSFLPGSYYPAITYARFLTPFTEAGDIGLCSRFVPDI